MVPGMEPGPLLAHLKLCPLSRLSGPQGLKTKREGMDIQVTPEHETADCFSKHFGKFSQPQIGRIFKHKLLPNAGHDSSGEGSGLRGLKRAPSMKVSG